MKPVNLLLVGALQTPRSAVRILAVLSAVVFQSIGSASAQAVDVDSAPGLPVPAEHTRRPLGRPEVWPALVLLLSGADDGLDPQAVEAILLAKLNSTVHPDGRPITVFYAIVGRFDETNIRVVTHDHERRWWENYSRNPGLNEFIFEAKGFPVCIPANQAEADLKRAGWNVTFSVSRYKMIDKNGIYNSPILNDPPSLPTGEFRRGYMQLTITLGMQTYCVEYVDIFASPPPKKF